MRYTDRLPLGAPVMVSLSSGVLVGLARVIGWDGAGVGDGRGVGDGAGDGAGDVIIVGSPDVVILLGEETFSRLTGRA